MIALSTGKIFFPVTKKAAIKFAAHILYLLQNLILPLVPLVQAPPAVPVVLTDHAGFPLVVQALADVVHVAL